MPGPASAVPNGNVKNTFVLRVRVNTAALATGPSTQERNVIVPGLLVGDMVSIVKPSFQADIAIGNVRVSAPNTLAILFVATANTPTPAVEDYLLLVARSVYDNPSTQLPTAIA